LNCFNISIICNDAFKTLSCKECLHTIKLGNNNISALEPDAFRGLKELEVLYADNNKIGELHFSMFQHNPAFRKLDVNTNRLRSLHPHMFVNLTSFYFLNVSYNMLVQNGAILNSRSLNILDAAYCNQKGDSSWRMLKNVTFLGLPNLTKLVLEGNAIECLDLDTFRHNPRLVELNLKNNELKYMSDEIFYYSQKVKYLYLSSNPLVCDCNMKVFSEWCSNHSIKLPGASCGTPLASWKLLDTLSCNTETLPHTFMQITDPVTTVTGVPMGKWTTSTCREHFLGSTTAETSTVKTTAYVWTAEGNMTVSVDVDRLPATSENSSSNEIKLPNLVEPSMQFTTQTPRSNLNVIEVKDRSPSFSWYLFVAIGGLIVSVVIVMVTVGMLRSMKMEGSIPATHSFTFTSGNDGHRTYEKVTQDCHYLEFSNFDNLHKDTGQKTELHYLSRDVTKLTCDKSEMPADRNKEAASCTSSGIVEANIDMLHMALNHEAHIYEEID